MVLISKLIFAFETNVPPRTKIKFIYSYGGGWVSVIAKYHFVHLHKVMIFLEIILNFRQICLKMGEIWKHFLGKKNFSAKNFSAKNFSVKIFSVKIFSVKICYAKITYAKIFVQRAKILIFVAKIFSKIT